MSRRHHLSISITLGAVTLLLFSSLIFVRKTIAQTTETVVLLSDNFESGANGWTSEEGGDGTCLTGSWAQEEDPIIVNSATHNWNMNPYTSAAPGDDCHDYLISPQVMVPVTITSPFTLTFFHAHLTEGGRLCNPPEGDPPCDFGLVEVSVNDGPWIVVSNRYEDTNAEFPLMEMESLDLSTQISSGDTVQVRWHFRADFAVEILIGGWWVDDVTLSGTESAQAPTAIQLNNATQLSNSPLLLFTLLLFVSVSSILIYQRRIV